MCIDSCIIMLSSCVASLPQTLRELPAGDHEQTRTNSPARLLAVSCMHSSPRVWTSVLTICESCDNDTNELSPLFNWKPDDVYVETGWLYNVLSNVLPGYHVDVRRHSTVATSVANGTATSSSLVTTRAGGGGGGVGRQDDTVPVATVNYLETMGWEVNNL